MLISLSLFLYWLSLIPFPLYCGSILSIISLDNGNFGFVLLILILIPLIDWIAGFESKSMNFSSLWLYLFVMIFLSFPLTSLLLFFICYESLIILLFFILFLFLPSYYRIRSAFFFFLFSIFGSISFVVALLLFILSEWLLSSLLILFPFFIKIPSFPFFYWLPSLLTRLILCLVLDWSLFRFFIPYDVLIFLLFLMLVLLLI